MTDSWKIGAGSGLIAGIASGIVAIILTVIVFNMGQPYYDVPSPPTTPLTYVFTVELLMNIVWGIVLGIIYSKFYGLIPGKHVSKGFVYGLILGLIVWVRCLTFNIAYFSTEYYFGNIISILNPIVYGLVLGILYEIMQGKYSEQKKLHLNKSDIINVVQAGAIAGLIGGIVISFAHALLWDPLDFPKYVADAEFLTFQFGTHALINMGWGVVFGILYVMFYDAIPGERISKGIIFSMIIFFMTSLRFSIYFLLYEQFGMFVGWGNGIFLFLSYGLILGALYKKPGE